MSGATELMTAISDAGQQTINEVGSGRGSTSRAVYIAAFAAALSERIRTSRLSLYVVLDWPVTVSVSGEKIDDRSFPVVIASPMNEDDGLVPHNDPRIVELPHDTAIDHVDLNGITRHGNVNFLPIIAIDISVHSHRRPFSKQEIASLGHRTRLIDATIGAIVNFGEETLRAYFPDDQWERFNNRGNKSNKARPGLIQSVTSDPALEQSDTANDPGSDDTPDLPSWVSLDDD